MDEPRSLLEAVHGVDQVYHVAGLTRARAARQFFRIGLKKGAEVTVKWYREAGWRQ